MLLIAAFNIALARNLDTEADEIARGRAQGERAALTIRDGRITAPEGVAAPTLETRAWVFAADSTALRSPPADDGLQAAARVGSGVAVVSLAPYNDGLLERPAAGLRRALRHERSAQEYHDALEIIRSGATAWAPRSRR